MSEASVVIVCLQECNVWPMFLFSIIFDTTMHITLLNSGEGE